MKRYGFFILLFWCFSLVPASLWAQGPTIQTQALCWTTPSDPAVDSTLIGYYIYTGRADEPLLINYLNAAGETVDVSAGGTIRVGQCDPDFSALGSSTNELFVYRLSQGEDYSLPLDTLDKYERFFFYGSGNDELNDTATISLPTFPDQGSNRYIGKRLFFHLQELTADSTSAVILNAPGDPSGSRLRQYNCYNDAVTSQNDTFTVTTEGIERLIVYTTVPRKATGDYFRECPDEVASGGGASDGVATAGTLDVVNQEIDMTVASPGSDFSISLTSLPNLAGFAAWDQNAADDFDGAWGSLTSVPAGFADNVDNVDDADADPANELQTVTWNAATRVLSLSDGGGNVTITDAIGTDNQIATEVPYDNSTSLLAASDVQTAIDLLENEIDAVSSGASDGVATAGALDVPNQEIDITVASPGSNFSIPLALLPTLSGFSGWDQDASDDFDGTWASLTGKPEGLNDGDNQALSLTSNTLSLTNGGSVDLSGYLDNTDAQELSLSGANLSISGGNTISLAGLGDGTGTDDQTAAEVPYTDNNSFGHTDLQGAVDSLVQEVQTLRDEQVIKPPSTSGTITANLANKRGRIFQVNLTPAPSPSTLVVNNPREAGVYTFQFIGVTNNDVAFPANFYNADETSLGTVTFTASDFITCLYDGADFYCK